MLFLSNLQLKSLLKLNTVKKIKTQIIDLIEINENELSENNDPESENSEETDDSYNSEESEELIIEKIKPKKKIK